MSVPVYDPELWYSPKYILATANYTIRNSPTREQNKKVGEAIPVSIACLAMFQQGKIPWWIQLVPESERAPDLRVMYYDKVDDTNRQNVLDVEVVTLGNYSSGDDIAQFILDTKLANPKKAYADEVAIVCYLNRKLTTVWREVHEKLAAAGKKNNVYAVGKVRSDQNTYQFIQLNPTIDILVQLEPDTKIPYQADILRGYRTGSKVIKPVEKHNPFDFV
jgi:hypothetical protein